MKGNFQVRFLGEKGGVILPTYPTNKALFVVAGIRNSRYCEIHGVRLTIVKTLFSGKISSKT